jgi:hypothetical protein
MGVITKAYIGIASVCIRYGDCSTHRRPSTLVDRRRKRFQGNSLIHTHMLAILPKGKPFITPFWMAKGRLMHRNGKLYGFTSITAEMKEALTWWEYELLNIPTRFILTEKYWPANAAEELVIVDASTSQGLGIYLPWQGIALYHEYSPKSILKDGTNKIPNINHLELLTGYAAILYLVSIQRIESTKEIIIMSDSKVACDAIANGTSDDLILRHIIKRMLLASGKVRNVKLCHMSGEQNPADLLTRGKLSEFKNIYTPKHIAQFDPPNIDQAILKWRAICDTKVQLNKQ